MELESRIEEFQKIADCRAVRKTLRQAGWAGIFFGGLALLTALPFPALDFFTLLFISLAILLLADGILNLAMPTPGGVILDGMVFLTVGAWNIFITVLDMLAGAPVPPLQWAIVGTLQIGWAVYRFAQYPRFRRILAHEISKEDLMAMEAIVKEIKAAKPKESEDVIGFSTSNSVRKPEWRGRLSGPIAVFVDTLKGEDVLFARKDEVGFSRTGKVLFGKALKANFRIRDRNLRGTISPASFEKYERWKSSEEESPPEAGPPEADPTALP